jgi:hypothetical protein
MIAQTILAGKEIYLICGNYSTVGFLGRLILLVNLPAYKGKRWLQRLLLSSS